MTIGKSSLHDYVQKKDGRYIEKKKRSGNYIVEKETVFELN